MLPVGAADPEAISAKLSLPYSRDFRAQRSRWWKDLGAALSSNSFLEIKKGGGGVHGWLSIKAEQDTQKAALVEKL